MSFNKNKNSNQRGKKSNRIYDWKIKDSEKMDSKSLVIRELKTKQNNIILGQLSGKKHCKGQTVPRVRQDVGLMAKALGRRKLPPPEMKEDPR